MKFNKQNIIFGMVLTLVILTVFGVVSAVTRVSENSITVNGINLLNPHSCMVDASGNGDYTTVQGCVGALASGNIFVKKGTYITTNDATKINVYNKVNLSIVCENGAKIVNNFVSNNFFNITNSKNIVIDNCEIDSGNKSSYMLYVWNNENIVLRNNRLLNPESSEKGAVEFYNVTNLEFTNNYYKNLWIVNIFGYTSNIVFTDNTCVDTFDSCISLGDSSSRPVTNFVIANNVFTRQGTATGYAVDIFGLARYGQITGNTAVGKGILMNTDTDAPKYITISANSLYNMNMNAIGTEAGTQFITIVGNSVFNTLLSYNDFVLSGGNSTFVGNVFNSSKLLVTGGDMKRGHNSDVVHDGFTSTGSINIGAYSLVTTSHSLKTDGARLAVRNNLDSGYSSMIMQDAYMYGELLIGGVTGSGKAVCVKADGYLGTCTDAVGAGGTCTCA